MNRLSRKEKVIECLSGIGSVLILAALFCALFLGMTADPYPYPY